MIEPVSVKAEQSRCIVLRSGAGGLTQRADAGAEAGHSAASVSLHPGGVGEQLAGTKHLYIDKVSDVGFMGERRV